MSKDYRSFAATTFGTVAFKMLEWLTPHAIDKVSDIVSDLTIGTSSDNASLRTKPLESVTDSSGTSTTDEPQKPTADEPPKLPTNSSDPADSIRARRTFRTSSSSKSSRVTYLDPLPPVKPQDKPALKSPTPNGIPEKLHWHPKSNAAVKSRGIPDMPTRPAFFEHVSTPTAPRTQTNSEQVVELSEIDSDKDVTDTPAESSAESEIATDPVPESAPESSIDYPLPQSLNQLNVDLVDFICDIFLEDRTLETPWLGRPDDCSPTTMPQNRHGSLIRRQVMPQSSLTRQWKTFNEQTIFHVLSNPRSLVSSFTRDEKLYDSHTLWYCMRRLTRVAPSLVFHSLWMAAESLFAPPRSMDTRNTSKKRKPLSNHDAGCVMSICLHALVAAAPTAPDSRTLYEMSRIRANGLVLPGNGVTARQPPAMCLDYDDIFSNDLALRLARRLFCAVAARHIFADVTDDSRQRSRDIDVLQPLLDQLDLLSTASVRILEFAQSERLLHETRVPTLLLDWARVVLLDGWDGQAEFTSDSAFGGALSLVSTMCKSFAIYHSSANLSDKNRNVLLLGDIQFRVDYFSERLDSIEMPVAWRTFRRTKQRRHILEYPYLFSPETLVSFFRSINFSRMSRRWEESSSLKTRMAAIVDPGSLITNPHHKVVLQDLLKTASAKYLILEIGRENVLRDAFDQLWRREERELLRPLKVHLGEEGGEEGFDSGGVQQEFFRMAMAECLDPQYGAFTVDDRTRMAWFVPGSVVESWKYELVGILVSLAVYNGLTLPITFPKALYRKLLGQPVNELHHIADGWPDLASGLTTLLEWDEKDGLVDDIFSRTYEFSVATLGRNVTRQMSKDGTTWPQGITDSPAEEEEEAPLVTNDNRDEYVSDYIRYLTDVSVRPQYKAFERGFRRCLERKSLSLLSPPILQSLVEGVQDIDVSELRRYTRYVGWNASHRAVRDFWSIVKKYDDRMKRKLLEFVTASDRVPVGGMRNLQFVVQKNGEEEEDGGHLPTAYTCYGTLLLPEYKDKDSLRERLGMALENAQGFGFA